MLPRVDICDPFGVDTEILNVAIPRRGKNYQPGAAPPERSTMLDHITLKGYHKYNSTPCTFPSNFYIYSLRFTSKNNPVKTTHNTLLPLLKEYFGFSSFRPLQEEIINDSLAGKDVFALLPTGGGKSLCYQLPALIRPGLTVVISPLISLMKDQVDALLASGIEATYINSSLPAAESRRRLNGLHKNEYRLLYVAPERALLSHFLDDVVNWNVNLIAVDEAHCISEWGHDFRPEYRQLVKLRKLMPDVPIMALTATATERVRADIHKHLQLRNANSFIASFNRPNLSYHVLPKSEAYLQLLTFLDQRKDESGIVYCQSRKTTESVAGKLIADGFSAAPYHAGMEASERTRNQELFLRDETRIICATIAFGMGINKSNVRFVVHYDLPKNIEGYYQETGRAGRDGLPSDCLLLFGGGDIVKQMYFIEEKENPHERRVAEAQLRKMVQYAESSECRRKLLLEYFGERYAKPNCDGCDNCQQPREKYDGTIEAQKFLSCVYRIYEKSGFNVGLRYVTEVLTGGDTEKIRRWNHKALTTYGVGNDRSRDEWMTIGKELIRIGLLQQQDKNGFTVVQVSPEGIKTLKERTPVRLTKQVSIDETAKVRRDSDAYDHALFDRLRKLRKRLADRRDVPPFVIFSDAALRQMAGDLPKTDAEFKRIGGVGERKLKDFGQLFIAEIVTYLRENPGVQIKKPKPEGPAVTSRWMNETTRETFHLFQSGKSVNEIAALRNLKSSTIFRHLLSATNAGEDVDLHRFVTPEELKDIQAAFHKVGYGNLTGVFEMLDKRFDYGVLRIVRASEQRGKI